MNGQFLFFFFLIGGGDGDGFAFGVVVAIRSSDVGQHGDGPGHHHGDDQTKKNGRPNALREKSNAIVSKQTQFFRFKNLKIDIEIIFENF